MSNPNVEKDRSNQSCVHEEVKLGDFLLALDAGFFALEIFLKNKS
jgi:hypothetical protein